MQAGLTRDNERPLPLAAGNDRTPLAAADNVAAVWADMDLSSSSR